jgi:nicotinamidase-related amidase
VAIDAELDPASCALVLMDYQPAVLASQVLDWARGRRMQVGHVRVAFTPSDHAGVPEGSKVFRRVKAGGLLADGTPGCEITERLAPRPTEIVVRKSRVGAFSTTDLDAQLRRLGVNTLILAGVSTSGVVLSTVRDASDRDYRILVVRDACADANRAVHEMLMDQVLAHQADVLEIADLTMPAA